MAKEKLNTGHYAELSDVAFCINHMVKEFMAAHPVIENPELKDSKEWQKEIKAIQASLLTVTLEAASYTKDNWSVVPCHRAYFFFSMVSELLMDKELSINLDKEGQQYAQTAADALWKLYQHLGSKLSKDEIKEVQ